MKSISYCNILRRSVANEQEAENNIAAPATQKEKRVQVPNYQYEQVFARFNKITLIRQSILCTSLNSSYVPQLLIQKYSRIDVRNRLRVIVQEFPKLSKFSFKFSKIDFTV